jgi:hypothetical protein
LKNSAGLIDDDKDDDDKTIAADGTNKYAQQKYDHGQSCWNGPERSTIVELECGDELESNSIHS